MINLSSGVNNFSVTWNPLNEMDVIGYVVAWAHEDELTNGDFNPADFIKNIGPETSAYFNVGASGTFHVKIAAYDTFESIEDMSYASLNWSTARQVVVLSSDFVGVTLAGEQFFKFNAGASSPTSASIDIRAELAGGLTTYDWEYYNGSAWVNLTGVNNTSTYTLTFNNPAWTTTALRVRCVSGAFSDETTIVKLYDGAAGTDGVDGSNGAPGASALTIILSNVAHVIPADNLGGVLSYANSGTTISVYEGTTQLLYDGVGTSVGTWKVIATGTGISAGSIVDSGAFATVGIASNMTTDTASVSYAIIGKRADGSVIAFNSIQTFSKVREGATGPTGGDGINAKYVLVTGESIFKFVGGAATPVNNSVVLSASLFGGLTVYDWEFWNGSAWVDLTGTQNTSTYTLAYNNTAWGALTALRVRCFSGGVYDETTIVKLYDGANGTDGLSAIAIVLSNPAHTFPSTSDGTVLSYDNSETSIQVFEGTNALGYDGVGTSGGTWKVTCTGTGITAGAPSDMGAYAIVGPASAMTVDSAYVTYTITGKRTGGASFSIDQKQSFTKSKNGAAGPGLTRSDTPPLSPIQGHLWFNTYATDRTYNGVLYYCNTQYQYVGASWIPTSPRGTLIGSDGIYTGALECTQLSTINGAITDAQIGNTIQSSDGGVTWKIDKTGGIEARNIVIKDKNGAVLLSSGSSASIPWLNQNANECPPLALFSYTPTDAFLWAQAPAADGNWVVIEPTSPAGNSTIVVTSPTITTLAISTNYILSFYAMHEGSGNRPLNVDLYPDSIMSDYVCSVTPSVWERYSVIINSADTHIASCQLRFFAATAAGKGRILIRNIKLEAGNAVTAWTPHRSQSVGPQNKVSATNISTYVADLAVQTLHIGYDQVTVPLVVCQAYDDLPIYWNTVGVGNPGVSFYSDWSPVAIYTQRFTPGVTLWVDLNIELQTLGTVCANDNNTFYLELFVGGVKYQEWYIGVTNWRDSTQLKYTLTKILLHRVSTTPGVYMDIKFRLRCDQYSTAAISGYYILKNTMIRAVEFKR